MSKAKNQGNFDKLLLYIFTKTPVLGKPLKEAYQEKPWFQHFTKYGLWLTIEYWILKGPLTVLFTDVLGFWYVIGAFFAGIICALIGFGLSEFWIWRGKKSAKV